MKYVSIDLETTGLDPEKDDIVEFGAVLDDLLDPKPLEELPRFQCYITKDAYIGSPYALSMHPQIFRRIAIREAGYIYLKPEELGCEFAKFLIQNLYVLNKHSSVTINAAGKNFAKFDFPFLKNKTNFCEHVNVRHRMIDPAMLYYQLGDETLPDTKLCMQRAGIAGEVAHTAIEDALVVVRLLRHKLLGAK